MSKPNTDGGGEFFPDPHRDSFPTGSTLFDLHCGGYAENQIISVFGKSGTGKSLFFLEAALNFIHKHKGNCLVRYHDHENAHDHDYARRLGIPVGSDCFVYTEPSDDPNDPNMLPRTVEDMGREFAYYTDDENPHNFPVLIICDSWDALSCEAEMDRDISEKNTYGMEKAKIGRQLARQYSAPMGRHRVTLMAASQSVLAIGGSFSYETTTGGSWLSYYPSQIFKIKFGEAVSNTRNGFKREYGRWLEVNAVKNRRQAPRKEVQLFLAYDFGVDDLMTCAQFFREEGQARRMWDPGPKDAAKLKGMKPGKAKTEAAEKAADKTAAQYLHGAWQFTQAEYDAELAKFKPAAIKLWQEIEAAFTPRRKKYGSTEQSQGE